MYEGKPILKKINKKNLNNPTLSSFGMRGIFYEPTAPPLVRDELRYDAGFKDSLQKTMEQEELYRKAHSSSQREFQSQQPPPVPSYEPLRMRYKNDVLGKVTEINMNTALNDHNFKGTCTSTSIQLRQKQSKIMAITSSKTFECQKNKMIKIKSECEQTPYLTINRKLVPSCLQLSREKIHEKTIL